MPLDYSEIRIGAVYSFEKVFLPNHILDFAKLTGDCSPLHLDPEFGKKSRFKSNVAHGMLAASLFSTLIGMHCPGRNSIYLSQTLQFKKPLFPGDSLTVQGTVISKSDSTRIVTLKTEILARGEVAVTGEAKALVEGGI